MDKFQTLKEKDNPTNSVYPNIKTQNIPDGGVTTAKILDEAVTSGKLSANSVTSDKIVAGAITTAKIATEAITREKIGSRVITSDQIAHLTIKGVNIATKTIAGLNLIDHTITPTQASDDFITEGRLGSEYWFKDTDFTTKLQMLRWVEDCVRKMRRPIYDDSTYISTIDSISTDQQEITIKCSLPLNGINSSITLSTDQDVIDFYNTTAGNSLCFLGF